jgi:hypothetical protein
MQETICAKVNPRLLTKTDRLFTGSMEGRIIEILQNARRAGATEVRITNKDGFVTVEDNGSGIDDFQKLLDLGGSGWDEKLEQGEDPAGVGLFSLAPRQIRILSKYHQVVIEKDGWTGKPVDVTESEEFVRGTKLIFQEEKSWDFEAVQKHAVFAGIRVIVDGKYCHSMPFCGKDAADYEELGCKVEVVSEMSKYHRQWADGSHLNKVLVNFHGQVVELDYWPGKDWYGFHRVHHRLYILVDLTQDTWIRLMLPARTKLVENKALKKLKEVIEVEYYRYFQKQKEHSLYYEEYLRARELGIDLPEAKPVYSVGLLRDEYDQVVEMFEPKNFKLSEGYLCLKDDLKDETGPANAHLLAALGKFEKKPFVPVTIQSEYIGYRWTNLPKVTAVNVIKGKERTRRGVGSYELVCVESLAIEIETSDEKKYYSEVPMATAIEPPIGKYKWHNEAVYVTQAARKELDDDNIWYHLGGYNCEGDSYETQQYYFEQELSEFWSILIGPYEKMRQELVSQINAEHRLYDKWQRVVITHDGTVTIHFNGGRIETVKRPAEV